jgi:hypothetical protein
VSRITLTILVPSLQLFSPLISLWTGPCSFTLASVAAQLNRAAVSHDGALPRRELDVSRSATKRNKPCTLEEAVDDTRSHLDDAFLHEDWQPFTVNYDVSSCPFSSVNYPFDSLTNPRAFRGITLPFP